MTFRLDAAVAELVAAIIEITVETEARNDGGPERLLSVPEAADAMSIGRTAIYSLISANRIRTIKIGRRRLIPASAIAEYAGRQA